MDFNALKSKYDQILGKVMQRGTHGLANVQRGFGTMALNAQTGVKNVRSGFAPIVNPIANTLKQGSQALGRASFSQNPINVLANNQQRQQQVLGATLPQYSGSKQSFQDILTAGKGKLATAGLLQSPLSVLGFGATSAGFQGLSNAMSKKPITQGIPQALGQGLNMGAIANPIIRATNPLLAQALNKVPGSNQLVTRTAAGIGNVLQGEVLGKSGMGNSALSRGIDFGVGFIGGKSTFQNPLPKTSQVDVNAFVKYAGKEGKQLIFKPNKLMSSDNVQVVDNILEQVGKKKNLSYVDWMDAKQVLKSITGATDEALDKLTPNKLINELVRHTNIADDYYYKNPGQVKVEPLVMGLSNQSRQKIRGLVKDQINVSTGQDDAIKRVNLIVDKALGAKQDKDYTQKLKTVRAELNRQMYELTGSNQGNFKKNYAILQKAKENPDIAQLIDNIENQMIRLDDVIKGTTPPAPVSGAVTAPVSPTRSVPKVSPQKTGQSPAVKAVKNQGTVSGSVPSTSIKATQVRSPQLQPAPVKASGQVETLAHTIAQKGTKERKFVTTVKKSAKTVEQVKQKVSGQYIPRANDNLSRSARRQITQDINTAREKALAGLDDESVAIANELISHYSAVKDYDSAAYIANTAAENLTAHGRAIQAASLYDKLTPEGIQRYAASQLNKVKMQLKPDDAKRISELAKKVQAMPAGEAKAMAQQRLMEEVQDLIPTPVVQKLVTLWKAGLLTGLKTTGRNVTSNMINSVSEVVKDVPATVTDMISSMFTGKRTKTLTLRGVGSGLKEGTQKGIKLIRTGFDERKQMGKLDTNRVNWGKSKIGQVAKAYTETIFRALGAQDQPFYYAALKRSLYDQAGAAAINAGKSGNKAFIENLVNNPTEQMIKTSVLDAERAVFQNKTALGSAINKAKTNFKKVSSFGGAIADFIVPFTGVPSSVASQVINYTPVGLGKTIIENIGKGKFDQRAFSEGIGRGLTGTAVMAIGSTLMAKGLMTLDLPKSEKERQQWELEGKKPFSVLVGGKWRTIGSLGPQASVLLQGGYLQQGGPGQAVLGGLKQQKEQTFLKGISSAADAIDNPQGYAKGYAQSVARGIVPTIVGDYAAATDPLQRETNTVTETIKSRIPGQRDDLLPKRNAFGEQMPNEQGFVGSMIDIFNSTKAKSSTIINELRRLQDAGVSVTPTKIDKSQTISGKKIDLTYELQDALESKAGPIIKRQWEQVISSPQYKTLSDDNKSKILQNLLENIRGVEKLRVAQTVAPNETAKAVTNLTKDQRQYIMSGQMPINYPTPEKQNIINMMNPTQVQQVNSVLNNPTMPSNVLNSIGGMSFKNNLPNDPVLADLERTRLRSELKTQINDIYDLYTMGGLSEQDAVTQIKELQSKYNSMAKPKKPKVLKLKTPKLKKIKIKQTKIKKIKLKKPKVIKLKAGKLKRVKLT